MIWPGWPMMLNSFAPSCIWRTRFRDKEEIRAAVSNVNGLETRLRAKQDRTVQSRRRAGIRQSDALLIISASPRAHGKDQMIKRHVHGSAGTLSLGEEATHLV